MAFLDSPMAPIKAFVENRVAPIAAGLAAAWLVATDWPLRLARSAAGGGVFCLTGAGQQQRRQQAAASRAAVSLAAFDVYQKCVSALRTAREEHNVKPRKKIGATLVVEDAGLRQALQSKLPDLCMLSTLDTAAVHLVASPAAVGEAAAASVTLVITEGVQVVMSLDVATELARLRKMKGNLGKDLMCIRRELNSAGFMAKAEPKYVEAARGKELAVLDALARVEDMIAKITAPPPGRGQGAGAAGGAATAPLAA